MFQNCTLLNQWLIALYCCFEWLLWRESSKRSRSNSTICLLFNNLSHHWQNHKSTLRITNQNSRTHPISKDNPLQNPITHAIRSTLKLKENSKNTVPFQSETPWNEHLQKSQSVGSTFECWRSDKCPCASYFKVISALTEAKRWRVLKIDPPCWWGKLRRRSKSHSDSVRRRVNM